MEVVGERLLRDFSAKINANIIKRCGGSLTWDKFVTQHHLSLVIFNIASALNLLEKFNRIIHPEYLLSKLYNQKLLGIL